MSQRPNKLPSALKHAAFSTITILPGEDEVSFNKLHAALIADLGPAGPVEEDIVRTLARLLWRKQNLSTFDKAALAKDRYEVISRRDPSYVSTASREEILREIAADKAKARKELGEAMELVEMGDRTTLEHFIEELTVVERIDGAIDRCLKRLLMVRGAKSMSLSPPLTPVVGEERDGVVHSYIEGQRPSGPTLAPLTVANSSARAAAAPRGLRKRSKKNEADRVGMILGD